MLKRAPNIYVPVEPEGDGIAIPSLLSIVVHCSIVTFILFSHRIPKIDMPPSIETSIVTPEQLADLQSEIIANREAMAASGNQTNVNANANVSDSTQAVDTDSSTQNNAGSTQQTTTQVSRPVSVFIASDEEPDEYTPSDVLVDPAIKQKIAEKEEAFKKAREANQIIQEEDAKNRIEAFGDSVEEDLKAEQERVKELLEKEANPAPVDKPRTVDKTFPTQSEPNTATSSSGSAGNMSIALGSKGSNGKSSSTGSKSSGGSTGGANNSVDTTSQVSAIIYRNWRPPTDRRGVRVTATFTVGANGRASNIIVNSNDPEIKASLENAIRSSNLSIAAGKSYNPSFVVK